MLGLVLGWVYACGWVVGVAERCWVVSVVVRRVFRFCKSFSKHKLKTFF